MPDCCFQGGVRGMAEATNFQCETSNLQLCSAPRIQLLCRYLGHLLASPRPHIRGLGNKSGRTTPAMVFSAWLPLVQTHILLKKAIRGNIQATSALPKLGRSYSASKSCQVQNHPSMPRRSLDTEVTPCNDRGSEATKVALRNSKGLRTQALPQMQK